MLFHVCSHFGDIEILPVPGRPGHCRVRYLRLTPVEKEALTKLVLRYPSVTPPTEYVEGEVTLPATLLEVAGLMGAHLHPGKTLLTAVKFADGTVSVTNEPNWWRRLFGVKDVSEYDGVPAVADLAPEPQAAVQVTMPNRGCPMPTATELKEAKAADVVRKFLTPQQLVDFNDKRAFAVMGNYTDRVYRITSRWNPECENFGVLYDVSAKRHVCASNLQVPPSEEILALKFAVENYERAFLAGAYNG